MLGGSTMICPNCAAQIRGNECEYCGYQVPKPEPEAKREPAQTVVNNYYTNSSSHQEEPVYRTVNVRTVSPYSKTGALIICIFLGFFGLHMFYVGRKGMGILYFFTMGLCGIGWLLDIFLILGGSFKDSNGLPLK